MLLPAESALDLAGRVGTSESSTLLGWEGVQRQTAAIADVVFRLHIIRNGLTPK